MPAFFPRQEKHEIVAFARTTTNLYDAVSLANEELELKAQRLAIQRKRARYWAEIKYRQERIEQMADGASTYDDDAESKTHSQIPIFAKEEIIMGSRLGHGSFGSVYEVQKIHLFANKDDEHNEHNAISAARSFMAEHCRRQTADASNAIVPQGNNEARYAIKLIRSALVQNPEKRFVPAMVDMATEMRILASIPHHPNIIKLRGIAATSGPAGEGNPAGYASYPSACFHEDFFLVLDRLYGTLEDRLERWQQKRQQQDDDDEKRRRRLALKKLWPSKSKSSSSSPALPTAEETLAANARIEFDQERLTACRDMASALDHLHRHRILHRDLKPTNIGFNIRGDLTIFDFGLSRQLSSTTHKDDLFRLTKFCGSPRYMAPEVGLEQEYNAKCDVHSFGLIAWQILTMQKPYEGCTIDDLKERVWAGEGILPTEWFKDPTQAATPASTGGSSKRQRSPFGGVRGSTGNRIRSISECLSVSNPAEVEEMVHRTLRREIAARPDMDEVEGFLRATVRRGGSQSSTSNGNSGHFSGEGVRRNRRRSTFVFRFNETSLRSLRSRGEETKLGVGKRDSSSSFSSSSVDTCESSDSSPSSCSNDGLVVKSS